MSGTRGCVNFLRQQNHIQRGSYMGRHYLTKFTVIQCHSRTSVYCTGRLDMLNMNTLRIVSPIPFTFFMVALILLQSSRNVALLLIYYFLWVKEAVLTFHWTFLP